MSKKLQITLSAMLIWLISIWNVYAFDIDLWIKNYIDTYLSEQNKLKNENQELKIRLQNLENQMNNWWNLYNNEEDKIIETIENISPSVVNIIASKDLVIYKKNPNQFFDPFANDPFFDDFFWNQIPFRWYYRQNNKGIIDENNSEKKTVKVWWWSGFIYSKDWLILTNKHVISDQDLAYTVILNDWTEFKAKILAQDPNNDIAVIKIDPNEHSNKIIKPIKLWDSKNLKVWQKVLAIWNALAEFNNTVTSWIISAKWRSITANNWAWSEQISNLLQTDAAINPWNSWWPLVNLKWEVIWMNTAIAQSAQWIWFAIPVNDLKFVADNVLNNWWLKIPYIWIRYISLDKISAKEYNIDLDYWALIKWSENESWVLENSPALKAWIEEMDIILEINWNKIWRNFSELREIILKHKVWDILNVKILRKWKELNLKIELWEFKNE